MRFLWRGATKPRAPFGGVDGSDEGDEFWESSREKERSIWMGDDSRTRSGVRGVGLREWIWSQQSSQTRDWRTGEVGEA